MADKGGRPEITDVQKEEILRKLQPYLENGLGVGKALEAAQVPKSTFYDLMQRDERFSEEIERFKNVTAILASNIIVNELKRIDEKQNGNPLKGIKPEPLSKDDTQFVWKFLLNSNLTTEEYGRRDIRSASDRIFDPEAEIQRIKQILEENTTEEILHN